MPTLSDFELRSLPGLWRQYEETPRRLAFAASTVAEAETWQDELAVALTQLLGGFPQERCDLDPNVITRARRQGYTLEQIVIQTLPGEYMPVYVLIPDGVAPPYRPVIALHGHGAWGARPLIGETETPVEDEFVAMLNYDYARQLALRGYLVFAPVLRGFGERMEDAPWREVHDLAQPEMWVSSCRYEAVNALMLGHTLLGLRLWDVIRLVDYVHSRPQPLTGTLGCVGLSGGGTVGLFATALEPRITCAVVSGYFNTFRDSIMSIEHCFCNYVPGLARDAEMADVAGLIAPRPLLVESGLADPIYPASATRTALAHLRPIYNLFGAGDRLDADLFEGGHRWSGAKAYDWLQRWL